MFAKKSVIGHKGLPFHCPHTEDDLRVIYESLDTGLNKGASFLDLGCGKGQLLSLLVEKYEGTGLGIDTNSASLSAVRTPKTGSVETLCEDMCSWIERSKENARVFDVVMCIGSLRSGRQDEMLRTLSAFVRPGGYMIIGELVWIKEPSQYFLDFLEMKKSDNTSQEELASPITESGLTRIHHQSLRSLESYECAIHRNVEEWASVSKDDPDCEKILELSTAWTNFTREYGWETWSFCTIIAQKPST